MQKVLGRIHSVETFGALDGPGIRYVVFMQGCLLRCIYCHNPDTWDKDDGIILSAEDVLKDILKYKNFISSGGVTISGGEPLMQPEFCLELINHCHNNSIHCAIDTSGGVGINKCKNVIEKADMLLLDIKALDDNKFETITQTKKNYSFEILDYCENIKKDVWIRHVIVPNITLNYKDIYELSNTLKKYNCIKKVEILPFHKMGEYKWKNMGLIPLTQKVSEPTAEEIKAVKKIFMDNGINVK